MLKKIEKGIRTHGLTNLQGSSSLHGVFVGVAVSGRITAVCGGFVKEDIQKSIESGR
jgi:hypothetical protein